MLTYPMNSVKGTSMYDHLYKCIKEDILSGKLESGEKLPSKRTFAKNLGVSVITVENAYSLLASEGYIYSEEKKGYYVAKLDKWIGPEKNTPVPEEKKDIFENNGQINKYKVDLINNIVNYERFPFSTWSKLTRQVLSEQDEGLLRAAPSGGIAQLRESISEYLYNYRGLTVSSDRIVIGSGTEYLYGILVKLTGRDRIYAVEDPGYYKVSRILEDNDVRCVHIAIDEYGMRVDELDKKNADIIHLTPSHHFPTGIVMPIQRRLELLDWAYESEDRYIIEDEYDCEFRYLGKPVQTLSDIDRRGHVIYINTFSKTLAPSFRISYMVLPDRLMERYVDTMSYMSCTVPNLDQYVLAKFIKEGYYERHINRMRVIYRGIRNRFVTAVRNNSTYGKYINIMEENAGLHFLIKVQTLLEDKELIKKAESVGLGIRCLSDYAYDKASVSKHIIIINYSGIREDNIDEAVGLLGEIIEKFHS